MSYLSRLIQRAVNPESGSPDLENNSIGNYRIEPQHGPNCYVYNIYKTIQPRFCIRFDKTENFLCDITITFDKVVINWDYNNKGNDLIEIHSTIQHIYRDKLVKIVDINEEDTMSNDGTQRSPFDFGIGS